MDEAWIWSGDDEDQKSARAARMATVRRCVFCESAHSKHKTMREDATGGLYVSFEDR